VVTKNDGAEHQELMRRVPSRGRKHRNLFTSLRSKLDTHSASSLVRRTWSRSEWLFFW